MGKKSIKFLKNIEKEIDTYNNNTNTKKRKIRLFIEKSDNFSDLLSENGYIESGYLIDTDDSMLYDLNKDDEEFENKYYKKMF